MLALENMMIFSEENTKYNCVTKLFCKNQILLGWYRSCVFVNFDILDIESHDLLLLSHNNEDLSENDEWLSVKYTWPFVWASVQGFREMDTKWTQNRALCPIASDFEKVVKSAPDVHG